MGTLEIQGQLLKAMRGRELTQTKMSEALGYSYNQVYSWEAGETEISWQDFLEIAKLRAVDVPNALFRVCNYGGDTADAGLVFAHVLGPRPLKATAAALGLPAYTLKRICQNETKLKLSMLLVALDRLHDALPEFLHRLAPIESFPSLAPAFHARRQRLRDVDRLVAESLVEAFFLEAAHDERPATEEGLYAYFAHMEQSELADALATLLAEGTLQRDGTRIKILVPRSSNTFVGNLDLSSQVATRYAALSRRRLARETEASPSHHKTNLLAQATFTCSAAIHARINELFAQCFEEARRLAREDPTEKRYRRFFVGHAFDLPSLFGPLAGDGSAPEKKRAAGAVVRENDDGAEK